MRGHMTAWQHLPGSGRWVNRSGSILRANEHFLSWLLTRAACILVKISFKLFPNLRLGFDLCIRLCECQLKILRSGQHRTKLGVRQAQLFTQLLDFGNFTCKPAFDVCGMLLRHLEGSYACGGFSRNPHKPFAGL